MRKPKAYGRVNKILVQTIKKHGVTLYDYSNVGNHLHILLKVSHVRRWPAFIRELTGRISQEMQGLMAAEGREVLGLSTSHAHRSGVEKSLQNCERVYLFERP